MAAHASRAGAAAVPGGEGVVHDVHGRRVGLRPGRPRRGLRRAWRTRSASARAARARYLNSPAAADLDGAARGEALEALGAITSLLGAAANGLLRRFDADDGHDADGYASAAAWLAAKNHLGRKDAKAAVRQMRLLARHPLLDAATAAGAITVSWAKEIAAWTGRIDHEELQAEADRILVDAADGGRGSGRPEDPRAGRLRGLARPGARPRGRPAPAAGSATGTCAWTPPSTAPGGSAAT